MSATLQLLRQGTSTNLRPLALHPGVSSTSQGPSTHCSLWEGCEATAASHWAASPAPRAVISLSPQSQAVTFTELLSSRATRGSVDLSVCFTTTAWMRKHVTNPNSLAVRQGIDRQPEAGSRKSSTGNKHLRVTQISLRFHWGELRALKIEKCTSSNIVLIDIQIHHAEKNKAVFFKASYECLTYMLSIQKWVWNNQAHTNSLRPLLTDACSLTWKNQVYISYKLKMRFLKISTWPDMKQFKNL